MNRHKVEIHSDGACLGNPGPGGYGIVMEASGKVRELSGGYSLTTNNRMELLGAITALETLKSACHVVLVTDSKYVIDGIEQGWAAGWKARGWRKADKKPVVNPDLWERLLQQCERHQVTFRWVRGHTGHAQNERCDELAKSAAMEPGLPPDPGYIGSPAT
ncbi:MAG: ribonuclease HI [Planctomycetota bacterium]